MYLIYDRNNNTLKKVSMVDMMMQGGKNNFNKYG